jgi:hypothetical protein
VAAANIRADPVYLHQLKPETRDAVDQAEQAPWSMGCVRSRVCAGSSTADTPRAAVSWSDSGPTTTRTSYVWLSPIKAAHSRHLPSAHESTLVHGPPLVVIRRR